MELNIDDSKQRILNESLVLFKKHGINYVTMDIIAGNLGISKKTLYVNFQSKEELLSCGLNHYAKARRQKIRSYVESMPNIIEALVAMFSYATREVSQFNPLFYDELSRYYPQLSKEMVEQQREEDYTELSKLINQGKVQGLILQDINADIVAKLLLVQIRHIADFELFPIDRYSRSELFQQIYINFIRGIATYEGQTILKDLVDGQRYFELQP